MSARGNKGRKLNYDKCDACRHDKKRCDPPNRIWPQKCDRCESMGRDCSENKDIRATGTIGDPASEDWQHLAKCQELELELSWFRRCKGYAAKLELAEWNASEFPDTTRHYDFSHECRKRIEEILSQVGKFLKCTSPMVRQAAFSVLSYAMICRTSEYSNFENAGFDEKYKVLLTSPNLSDRVDVELSLRECTLRNMHPAYVIRPKIIDAIRDYYGACQRYIDRIRQCEHLVHYGALYPPKVSLPFSGNARILDLLMEYSSEVLFQGRDVFSNNTLLVTLWISEKNVEQLIRTMDNDKFLQLTRSGGIGDSTILHLAAIRNAIGVFKKVEDLGSERFGSAIDFQDGQNKTPLLYAASKGNGTIVKILLELGADPALVDTSYRNALHYAVANKHEDITNILIDHSPTLCISFDEEEETPVTLAARSDHPRLIKLFFSQTFLTTLKTNDNGANIWMHLLRVALKWNYPEAIELLNYDPYLGQIDQLDEEGRTALQLLRGQAI